jgi:hypothetical protein
MKKIILILLLCSLAYAASEIRTFQTSGNTYFAVIRETDGDVWHVVDEQFEVWGTDGNDADDYDIALTDKSGGMFVGDFNTAVSDGYYYVVTHEQAGGNPVDGDAVVDNVYGYWNGSAFRTQIDYLKLILDDTDPFDTAAEHATAIWNALIASYGTAGTYGEELEELDPNVTAILGDTSTSIPDLIDDVNTLTQAIYDWTEAYDMNDVNDVVWNSWVDDFNEPNSTGEVLEWIHYRLPTRTRIGN